MPRTITDLRVLKTEYLSEVKQQKLKWKPINFSDLVFDDVIKFYLFVNVKFYIFLLMLLLLSSTFKIEAGGFLATLIHMYQTALDQILED
jgi:hypothetical protein